MLLLLDVLLMPFNLVLFKSLLIGKFNGVSRCKQLGVQKLLLIEKSIVLMSWGLLTEIFWCNIFIDINRNLAESCLIDFVYFDVNFVKTLLSRLRSREGFLLVPSTDCCRSYKALEYLINPSLKSYWHFLSRSSF